MGMVARTKVLSAVGSLFFLTLVGAAVYLTGQKVLALPFRATNDYLHQRGSPVTLDSLIPGGTYINEKMTIEEVARIRFAKPKDRVEVFVQRLSESVPVKYRLLGTGILYIFYVFLFLAFFRVFTWARYTTALSLSFLLGAVVYYFMPDMIMGRWDDAFFLVWSVALLGTLRWYRRRKRARAVAA
jgi:hypothetical protein